MTDLKKLFDYCPSCGSKDIRFDGIKEFRCKVCSFTYYHNVAIGVGAILELDGKIVVIERGKEPGKGKLDLPGGFVEAGETAEEALVREVREEIGIAMSGAALQYFGSYPNMYKYKGVVYQTCDLFFHCRTELRPKDFDEQEVQSVSLVNPAELSPDKIAFPSVRSCLGRFLQIRKNRDTD